MPAWSFYVNQFITFLLVGWAITTHFLWRCCISDFFDLRRKLLDQLLWKNGLEEVIRDLRKDNVRLQKQIEEIRSTINFPKQ